MEELRSTAASRISAAMRRRAARGKAPVLTPRATPTPHHSDYVEAETNPPNAEDWEGGEGHGDAGGSSQLKSLLAMAVDESIAMFYLNLVVLNAHKVAQEKIAEKIKEKTPNGPFGFAKNRLARTAGYVGSSKGAQMLTGKLGEQLCTMLQTKMKETAGLVISVTQVYGIEGKIEGKKPHLIVLAVRVHDVDLDKLLSKKLGAASTARALACLGATGALGKVKRLIITSITPTIGAKLAKNLPKSMAAMVGLQVLAQANKPADQWLYFQSCVASQGLPGSTIDTFVPAAELIGYGVPEFLRARSVANPAFLQDIDEERDAEGLVEPRKPSLSCAVAASLGKVGTILTAILTGLGPLVAIGSACISKCVQRAHRRAVEKASEDEGRKLSVRAVRAEGLYAAVPFSSSGLAGLQSPFVVASLVLRGANASSLVFKTNPYTHRTPACEGGGRTFIFDQDSVAEVAVPPTSLQLLDEAALHVEVRNEPRAPCIGAVRGDARLLIGSAMIKLRELAIKAQDGEATVEVNLHLLRPEEMETENAQPSAGLIRLRLHLSAPTPAAPMPDMGKKGASSSNGATAMEASSSNGATAML